MWVPVGIGVSWTLSFYWIRLNSVGWPIDAWQGVCGNKTGTAQRSLIGEGPEVVAVEWSLVQKLHVSASTLQNGINGGVTLRDKLDPCEPNRFAGGDLKLHETQEARGARRGRARQRRHTA